MHGDSKDSRKTRAGFEYGDGAGAAVPMEASALLPDLDSNTRQFVLAGLDGPTTMGDGDHLIRRGDT